MSINHLFDGHKPSTAPVEYGAERQALLQRVADQQRTITTLQTRVDSLVAEVSRLQTEAMSAPKVQVRARSRMVDKYRALFVDTSSQLTVPEMADRLGCSKATVFIWLKGNGYAAGIVPVGTRKTGKRGKPTTAYGCTADEPRSIA